MQIPIRRSPLFCCSVATAILAGGTTFAAGAAPAIPNPCKLVTQAEMQELVGPLGGAPKATDPSSGEITCSFTPAKGPSFVDISLHDGDIAAWKKRHGGKNPSALPEFGSGAFVNPDFEGYADLYAKKGNLILRVTMPKSPKAVDIVKAIATKALPRL
ncbi:MAG: hypothetical protein ABL931_07010 [Usitatibacteraceae bacterium]